MDYKRALEVLGDTVQEDGGLYNLGHYISWDKGDNHITLDCSFDADELEAIVVYMRENSSESRTRKN